MVMDEDRTKPEGRSVQNDKMTVLFQKFTYRQGNMDMGILNIQTINWYFIAYNIHYYKSISEEEFNESYNPKVIRDGYKNFRYFVNGEKNGTVESMSLVGGIWV